MAQAMSVGLNERRTSVDDTTGAQLVEISGDVAITTTIPVIEKASTAGWTFLRTISSNDASVVDVSTANITTPFCRLRFDVTGSGSCVFQVVEVHDVEGADAGILLHEAFKSGADSVSVTEDSIYPGVSARGAVEVNASQYDTIVVKVYVQES